MKTWNERLKLALKESGVSQQELATAARVKPASVSDWVSGKTKNMKHEYVDPVCKRLGITEKWLFGKKAPMWRNHVVEIAADGSEYESLSASTLGETNNVHIPLMDVAGSQGFGLAAPERENIIGHLSMSKNFLRENFSLSGMQNLRLITGYGDSMAETIHDGDVIVVGTGVREIKMDSVFVLRRDDELFIKRIQRIITGGFMVISDNKTKYEPYQISDKDFSGIHVCGRALMVWNGRKL